MSYDIEVWSVDRPDLAACLPTSAQWVEHGGAWVLERRGWQIVCGPPDAVLPEDVPEEVSVSQPGVSFLTQLVLEPIGSPASAYAALLRAARAVARAGHGVVLDGQTGELTTPRGVRRFVPETRPERFAVLDLGWWFLGDRLLTPEGLNGLLDIFEALLPEAIPRRYGLFEPPQFQLAQEGREHLAAFLLEHLDDITVLYPHRPVLGLGFSCARERFHPRHGFRCNRIDLQVEAAALTQPGWQEGLRRFWLRVCDHLDPFYAEVRTLHGYVPMGATFGGDMNTEIHPIRSRFWRGIPRELGHAVAIGAPYVDLWPQARAAGRPHGDLIVLDAGSWTDGNELTVDAPEGIRQKGTPGYTNQGGGWRIEWVSEYPETWPFGTE